MNKVKNMTQGTLLCICMLYSTCSGYCIEPDILNAMIGLESHIGHYIQLFIMQDPEKDSVQLEECLNKHWTMGHPQAYFLDHYEQLLNTEQRTLVVVPPGAEEQLRFNYDSMLEAMSKNHAWLFLLHEKLDKAEKKEKSYSKMPAILLDLAGRMDSMVLSYRRGMLREHYKWSRGSIYFANTIAIWNDTESKLQILAPSNIWERRRNLRGTQLQLGFASNRFSHKKEDGTLSGYHGEIATLLSRHLNFSMTLLDGGSNDFGVEQPNGSFSGLVGGLVSGKYDMVATALSHTYERSKVIDFPFAISEEKSLIFIFNPGKGFQWLVYTRVIQAETWLGVLALVFLFLLSSRLLGFSVQLEREKVLSFIFCSMLNRELNFTPPRWSARIFGLTVLMSGFVIFSLYCALFISFLTVKTVNWPFTNLAELLETDYMLDMFAGSTQDSFKNSNDPVVKRVYEEKKHEVPNDEHRSYEEDVMRYQGQKMAFLRTEGMIRTFKGYPCEIAAIPGQVYAQYYGGIALSKNSDLLPLISHFLLKFKQTGHLEKWHKQQVSFLEVGKENDCPNDLGFGFESTGSLFILLLLGALAAILISMMEKMKKVPRK